MNRYVLTLEAQADLQKIRQYLNEKAGPRVARHVVCAFIAALRRLARSPGMGHLRDDITENPSLLFWPVFSYLIVYRRGSKPLAIVAIVHGKRDLAAELQQRDH